MTDLREYMLSQTNVSPLADFDALVNASYSHSTVPDSFWLYQNMKKLSRLDYEMAFWIWMSSENENWNNLRPNEEIAKTVLEFAFYDGLKWHLSSSGRRNQITLRIFSAIKKLGVNQI